MKGAAEHEGRGNQSPVDALLRVLDSGLGPALLERALTHRSFAYEHGGLPTNDEELDPMALQVISNVEQTGLRDVVGHIRRGFAFRGPFVPCPLLARPRRKTGVLEHTGAHLL